MAYAGNSSNTLDLGSLLGTDVSKNITEGVLESLLQSMESLQTNTNVTGTGNIFKCAISLGDFNFNLNMDLFKMTPTKMDYILIKKIQYLRRLITDINDIFISLIQDLECCTGDDRYNKTVVPIFKWLVEDENGLCGSLLTIARGINTVYLPLKRILCLFKIIPGNPTLGMAGTDIYKFVYPIVDGMEKTMNMLDNGRFLDLLIIPIKDFHDKLVACSSGSKGNFYSGYTKLQDIISDSVYSELTANFIDSIKAVQGTTINEAKNAPVPPTPPIDEYIPSAPVKKDTQTYEEYSAELYNWNIGYSEYRKSRERQYDSDYSDYLIALHKWNQTNFEKKLSIGEDTFQNSSYTGELLVDDFKNRYRSICGCLGEIFRLDGLFIPKDLIIRDENDFNKLVGEVKYQGLSIDNYYTNEDESKIKIITKGDLNTLRSDLVESSFSETMKYPIVKTELLDRINQVKNVGEVINLNLEFNKELIKIRDKYRKASNFYDAVNTTFYSVYTKELNDAKKLMAEFNSGQVTVDKYEEARKIIYSYAEYPPASWLNEDKHLPSKQIEIYGDISYLSMVKGTEELNLLKKQMDDLDQAIGRNYTAFKIVDDTSIECGCDLLCKILKYLISMIMQVVKLLLSYIVKYLASAIANKELMWWIKFIQSKIQCIVDLANLSNDLKEMERRFDQEMKNAEGSIRKVPESLANCSTTKSSIIDEINLSPLKASVSPNSIKDITWTPTKYPDFGYDVDLGAESNYDITPTFQNSFNLDTNAPSIKTDWKNRTIPTLELDCTKDHKVVVDWVPTSNSWKMFLNIQLNPEQLESGDEVVLNGNIPETDEEIIESVNKSTIYKIMSVPVGVQNFWFKFIYLDTEYIFEDNTSSIVRCSPDNFIIGELQFNLNNITKVWFYVEGNYYKVFDKIMSNSISEYLVNSKAALEESLKKLQIKTVEFISPEQTNSKVCSASSLEVTLFEPIFNDETTMLYPGQIIREDNSDGSTFTFKPKSYKTIVNNPDGTSYETIEYFTNNNTPFKLVLTNGSGKTFTVVLLIDICVPENVINTSYSKDIDGIFLNGRYDYIEFASIANNSQFIITSKNIISKLRGYLENIGAISAMTVGPASQVSSNTKKYDNIISNTPADNNYSEGFDSNQDVSNAKSIIENLPNGTIKDNVVMFNKLYEAFDTSIEEIKTISEAYTFDSGINEVLPNIDSVLVRQDSKLGIPLAVLNEEQNIILTIHEKRLKLINISGSVLNLPLVTEEIDYIAGEQLFIEFSTTGFNHTISWTNERKITSSATIMATSIIPLKPTQIGSVYKDINGVNTPIALMCGMLLDIIFTEGLKTKDDWMNNSNTYRPNGTIGFYDFSVFDGYHVYAIPEFFKVTQIGKLATAKGILYESKEYTREEILIKIQDGELNSILSNEVVIVGEKPISVGGDFIWKNKKYYKNVTFGYLDNFFCRDNLSDTSFTISFWLKMKDSVTNDREDFSKKYIFSDTHNGNFIWLENNILKIQLFGQPLREEPAYLIFKKDSSVLNPEWSEKWFHHVFKYDKASAKVYYTIEAIDQKRNFDIGYPNEILNKINIQIPLVSGKIGKKIKFSLVTMLARYDVKMLKYTDMFDGEIAALAIWNNYKDANFMSSIYNYQKRIIINDMD